MSVGCVSVSAGIVTLGQINRLVLEILDGFPNAPLADGCLPVVASSTAASLQEGSPRRTTPTCRVTGQAIVIGSHSSMAGSDRVHPDWGSAVLNSFGRD